MGVFPPLNAFFVLKLQNVDFYKQIKLRNTNKLSENKNAYFRISLNFPAL